MKRKDFIKNSIGCLIASLLPSIILPISNGQSKRGLKAGERYQWGYKAKNIDGVQTYVALTKEEIADIKLQHAMIKSKPEGVYIDLKKVA